MTDRGLTHIALTVRDIEASLAFYARYAAMEVVHRRTDPTSGHTVAWISDLTRPFVVVLIEVDTPDHPLGPTAHLGVGVESRDAVDAAVRLARAEGLSTYGPHDDGHPVGYWAIVHDPDGHALELAFGQEVGLTVAEQAGERAPAAFTNAPRRA